MVRDFTCGLDVRKQVGNTGWQKMLAVVLVHVHQCSGVLNVLEVLGSMVSSMDTLRGWLWVDACCGRQQ
jgi:hypothetical protein